MGKYSGRTMLLAGVPLVLATSGLAAGCGLAGSHHAAAADEVRTTSSTKAPSAPAAPSVPALAAVPRQGDVVQTVGPHRGTLVQTAAYTQVSQQALSAYQRAAQVIDTADPSCRLSWTLLAALGQVEARHGAYGPVLDGRHGRPAVPDTDGGAIDGNTRWDRAVGPMQLLPSTWSQVAVDADGDGKRDPQDVDDASLGAAVYLCGNHDDLGTRQGKRSAVFRYNHSRPYVLFVLALSHRYTLSEQALSPLLAARTVSTSAVDVDPLATTAPADQPTVAVAVPKQPKHTSTPAAPVAAPAATASTSAGSSGSSSPTTSGSASPSPSGSASPSCPTGTPTSSPSTSPSPTPVPGCPTPSASASPTPEPTGSSSPSGTPTATETP